MIKFVKIQKKENFMTNFEYQRLDGKKYTDEGIKRLIKENDVKFIRLQFVDLHGQVKNLAIPS